MRHKTLLFLAVAAAGATPAAAQADEPIGEVAALSGPANVLRGDAPNALYIGAEIHRDDVIRTLDGAKLRIVFDDGSELVLGAHSLASMAEFAPEEGRGMLDLLEGILRVVIPRAGDWRQFEVETRNAVASARSTQWVVELSPDGTAVFVVEGEVAVRAVGQKVLLGPGEGSDVPPDAAPGAATEWGDARVDDVLARTTLP